jgi:hypothetical protein
MMKKAILVICFSLALTIDGLIPAAGQEQPKPEKDTVNMDTNAKPKFYYSTEDENSGTNGSGKSSAGTIAIIAGAVIVVGAVAFFLLKKKK